MNDLYHLFIMFITAFGAATILPFGSEPVYLAYIINGSPSPFWLTIFASLGNILGGVLNYWFGMQMNASNEKFKFIKNLEKAEHLFNKWGGITLLFSWVFIIGDAFTVLAGVARYNFFKFVVLMSIGKIFRFVFLWASVVGFNHLFT